MQCTSCSFDNREGAKFCNECGVPLMRQSSVQSLESKKQERTPTGLTLDPRLRDSRLDAAERRQLTVMFCDLVGSTALSTQLDPEELREVEREYQRLCGTVIKRFGGHLAKYLGDGLLVYFGYPVAHEDDAARAVRAGLEIVAALQHVSSRHRVPSPFQGEGQGEGSIAAQPHPPHPNLLPLGEKELRRLQVRIGIHTGLVVAGEMGTEDQPEHLAIVGETPNLAARIQGQANPDEVVISAATYRLVEGLFACEERGQPELKGVAAPLTLYRVLKEAQARSRFEVVVRKGLTPLIGRDDEVGVLRERWTRARQGDGQVVLLSGEPGIGKSRLAQVLKEDVIQDRATEIEFRCSPYHQNTAWHPIIEHLQRVLQFDREETPAAKLAKLQHTLSHYRFPQTDTMPLLATLLSLPHPEGHPPITLSPQKQKQRTQEALVAWIIEEAERKAVASIWEDLHWADPSTLELLQLYLDQVPTNQIFTLLTFRPEFHPPWPLRSHMSQITLGRLGRVQVEEMVERVASDKALPTEIVQQIVSKTDGVPLFVEELTKSVIESVGTQQAAPLSLAIPATLQDSLMGRLDRLGDAKVVAQLGATLGREFSYELLQAVSLLDEEVLLQDLHQLVVAELIYQYGLPPQAQYSFKHALIQDTAYQSLLKSTRKDYHKQIAQVLEERFPETKEMQPELLAHHYTEAGLIARAIPYWHKAGQNATQRSANVEAISHLTKGLALLKTLPDSSERVQQELALQAALGTPLIVTKGHASLEVEQAYARALELCQQMGETPQLFPVLFRLASFHYLRAELHKAQASAEQLLRLAQTMQDPGLLVWPHLGLGLILLSLGELPSALSHMEQSIAFYDPQKHRPDRFPVIGQDPKVNCLSYTAWALWRLGYPDQARKRMHEALTLAEELSHPFSLAFALNAAAVLDQFLRDVPAVQERTEALLTLAREQGFPVFVVLGTIFRGWVLAEQGQGKEGIAQIRQGMVAKQTTGTELGRPGDLAQLAVAYGKAGQAEEGLSVQAEALEAVAKSGERFYEAELYRLKGELTLQSSVQRLASRVKEAEECFLKAIEIAKTQQAKSFELRAAMSLARLWQQQALEHGARNKEQGVSSKELGVRSQEQEGESREQGARNTEHATRTTQYDSRIKLTEAHRMLSEVYKWFTEGFDTKDLQEAKALLDSLASSV